MKDLLLSFFESIKGLKSVAEIRKEVMERDGMKEFIIEGKNGKITLIRYNGKDIKVSLNNNIAKILIPLDWIQTIRLFRDSPKDKYGLSYITNIGKYQVWIDTMDLKDGIGIGDDVTIRVEPHNKEVWIGGKRLKQGETAKYDGIRFKWYP